MKTLATYRVTFTLDDAQAVSNKFDESIRKVNSWLDSKGELDESTNPPQLVLKDNRIARLESEEGRSELGRFRTYQISEPTNRGEFVTLLELSVNDESIELNCVLSEKGSPLMIQPMSNTARCPKIFRAIVGSNGDWKVGINPVLQTPIRVSGTADAKDLIGVIFAKKRKIPVVAVSENEETIFYPELAENLARDLCGLAFVVQLDEEASWGLTNLVGRKWSCYNHAIRVYWPDAHVDLDSPKRHPVWTVARLFKDNSDGRYAGRRLRDQLRRWLMELSTFAQSGISLADQIRVEIRETKSRRARVEQDWEGLANLYAKDNDKLKRENEQLRNRNSALGVELTEKDVELTQVSQAFVDYSSWRDQDQTEEDGVSYSEPQTVEDAVEQARSKHGNVILFGSDVEHGVKSLQKTAGPPQKVLQYLDKLAEMTRFCVDGRLSDNPIQWLQKRNVDASDESDSILNNRTRMSDRMWDDGTGKRQFRYHLKPSNATSPDRCVRIYFEFINERRLTVVGWVGRHL